MSKIVTCDICGKEAEEDCDGACLCEYHTLKKELRYLKEEYKELKENCDYKLNNLKSAIDLKQDLLKMLQSHETLVSWE